MPVIPTIESERSTMVGGIDVYASGEAFGSQIGAAIGNMGDVISRLGAQFKQQKDEQEALNRGVTVAEQNANSSLKWSQWQVEGQQNAAPGAEGFADTQLAKMREDIETTAANIKDPIAAAQYRKSAYGRLVEFTQSNMSFELKQKQLNTELTLGNTLNSLENGIRMNADSYKNVWIDGNALIESDKTLSPLARDAMKAEWQQRTTFARFNSLLDHAQSTTDFDAIEADLNRDVFKKALKPEQMNNLANQVQGARKTFMTQASTAADAALDSATKRQTDSTLIPPDELGQLEKLAMDSRNPIMIRRFAEVSHNNALLERFGTKSAAEINAASKGIVAGGFGLPDQINTAVQSATTAFPGVPANFIAGTVQKEYGGYFPKQARGDRRFAPRTANSGIILDKVQPGVYNAATLAGEIFGSPLTVTSGYRSAAKQNALRFAKGKNPYRATIAKDSQHTHGTAIDISTAGMSETDKAKLFDSLLQAGFTAFGDYGKEGYIHADMRTAAPSSVGAKGPNWLGWTNTSPEVMNALKARGYGAGVGADKINRTNASRPQQAIDFGKGPLNGASTAIGVGQFVEDTWLEMMADTGVTQRMGINTQGMSRQQILDLRKDPKLSTMAIAANAEKNNKILAPVLGRSLDASELYMAHFLGTGGANILFTAYRNSPDAVAKDVLPKAYKGNEGMFEDRTGRAYSVKEFHDRIAIAFSTAPNQAQYADAKFLGDMAKGRRTAETTRTMDQYQSTVLQGQSVNDLSAPGGFATRAQYVKAAADTFDLAVTEAMPFTELEADKLKKMASEGTAEDKLNLMREIVSMDNRVEGTSQAALNQLGIKNTAMAFAAERMSITGDAATSELIVRGQERLTGKDGKTDTAYANSIFVPREGGGRDITAQLFNEAVGQHLRALGGDTYRAAYDATRAYYAERFGRGDFDANDFATAARTVVGAEGRVFEMNGEEVITPPGIQPQVMERVFENLRDEDVITLSKDGKPPVDHMGNPVSGREISDYGILEWVGGTEYRVRMRSDDQYLSTGEVTTNDLLKSYIVDADAETITRLAMRPDDTSPITAPTNDRPVSEQPNQGLMTPQRAFERGPDEPVSRMPR